MRILHVVGALNRGGAETWLVQLLNHIDRSRYQFDFLVHTTDLGAYDDEVRALGARIIPCLEPSNPLRYALNFRRALREFGPYDCVHSHVHYYTGYVLMLAAMMRVPMRIAHSHSDTRTIDGSCSLLRRTYLSGMDGLIRRFATTGIAVSEYAARSLFSEAWKSDPRWSLSPLGIDLSPFNQEVDSQEIRAQLGISSDSFVVGHVGRFVEEKNHRFLVDIAECFCRLEPKAIFLLVGDGRLRPEIEDLVHKRRLTKHFIFTGVRPDVPKLMKGAMDCFLFPSLYEGLGLVLWEAQAAGLHCIVSDSVPSEGDIGEAAVTRLSLAASPNEWAVQMLTTRSTMQSVAVPDDWIKLRSIEGCASRVEALYVSLSIRIQHFHAAQLL